MNESGHRALPHPSGCPVIDLIRGTDDKDDQRMLRFLVLLPGDRSELSTL
jgi:hypothetical protein